MKENKLDVFRKFISDHLKFKIVEPVICNDSPSYSEQQYLELPKADVKMVLCGNLILPQFIEQLNHKKTESIIFLNKTFKAYRENFNSIISFSEEKLKGIRYEYSQVNEFGGVYNFHHDLQVTNKMIKTDTWGYEAYAIEQKEAYEINKFLNAQIKAIDEVINAIKDLKQLADSDTPTQAHDKSEIQLSAISDNLYQVDDQVMRRVFPNLNDSDKIARVQNQQFYKNNKALTTFSFNHFYNDDRLREIHLLWYQNLITSDFETFKKAFLGDIIHEPLGIKWTVLNDKKESAILSLIHFIKSDLFRQEGDKKMFTDKMVMVFSDHKGIQFTRKQITNGLREYNMVISDPRIKHREWKDHIDEYIEHVRKA